MPRPRKYPQGYTPWTLMRLGHGEDVYRKAEELAERERIPLSELVLKALAEHVKAHYPGNPQVPLLGPEEELRAYLAERKAAILEHLLDSPWPDREAWRTAVDKQLDTLMKFGVRTPRVRGLISQALETLG